MISTATTSATFQKGVKRWTKEGEGKKVGNKTVIICICEKTVDGAFSLFRIRMLLGE